MDGDRMCDFDTVYKSTLKNFETLRSIHASIKTANHVGSPENVINATRNECPSVKITGNNIQESITDIQIHRATENGMVSETQGRTDNQTVRETSWKDKENVGRLSKTVIKSPSQSMENLRNQARQWACEKLIRVFEDHSGEVGKIETHNHDMSKILRNVTKVLQEKVEEVQVKSRRAAELEEALSAEKSLVDAIGQKRVFLQELLDKAFDTAENGIFMCNQCQFVAEKVKEPYIYAKMDPDHINSQFMVNGKRVICHIANDLQSRDSTTSLYSLPESVDGKKESLISPSDQRTNNLTSNICDRAHNETCHFLCKNGCSIPVSKLANGNYRRVDLEIDSDVSTHSDPLLKRKWLDDCHDKEGGSPKAPKISMQVPNMQCSNGSKECHSLKSSEAYYRKHSYYHIIGEPYSICDHAKNEHREHSMGQAAAFKLLLEEEFDDDPK